MVQKNYVGILTTSQSLIDQAVNQNIVKQVGTAEVTDEQRNWLTKKGYKIPTSSLAEFLRTAEGSRTRTRILSDDESELRVRR